jgi:signal transduction histidine kinase
MVDKVSILLVDDRPDKLMALESILAELGENLVTASSGNDALRWLLRQEFAVILLDVEMPMMNGFETAKLIRQRVSSLRTPIIFVTAYAHSELELTQGYALGAVDYIYSPVVPEVLRAKVAAFADLFRKTQQMKAQADSLRRQTGQLHRLTAASLKINSALSLEVMMQLVTDTARDLLGARRAVAHFAPLDNPSLRIDTISPPDRADVPHTVVIAPELRPIANGAAAHPVVFHADGRMSVSLTGRGGSQLGLLEVSEKDHGEFNEEDHDVLLQLAQIASIAAENTLNSDAQAANRIKDEFIATLSHELRTPLAAMLGWTRILRTEDPTPEDLAHGLEVIERNVHVQSELVEDLLDVSRILSGKMRLNCFPLEVRPIVKHAIASMKAPASAKGIGIEASYEHVGLVSADQGRLGQIIRNLLSNAIKFTPAGGAVSIVVNQVDRAVQIEVSDNGRGIKPEFLPYVFERFRQADGTSTRSSGGLGLGLAIVRHLVELHGGTVEAKSGGEGKGATFCVRLPQMAAANEPPTSEP